MNSHEQCQFNYSLVAMTEAAFGTSTAWTATEAFSAVVDTCSRCSVRQCPGILRLSHNSDDYPEALMHSYSLGGPAVEKVREAVDSGAFPESANENGDLRRRAEVSGSAAPACKGQLVSIDRGPSPRRMSALARYMELGCSPAVQLIDPSSSAEECYMPTDRMDASRRSAR